MQRIEPVARIDAKETAKPRRGIRRDGTSAGEDVEKPALRNPGRQRGRDVPSRRIRRAEAEAKMERKGQWNLSHLDDPTRSKR